MTMREGWANAYVTDYGPVCGKFVDLGGYTSKANAEAWARLSRPPAFLVHAKLKPEGAPKRYADDVERYAWERAERLGIPPRYA